MFTELLPLVTGRPLTITIVGVERDKLRLNVVPHSLEKDDKINTKINHSNREEVAEVPEDAINALTTPLAIVATPDELDKDLPALLTQFVEKHRTLQEAMDRAAQQISDAVKAVEERKKAEKPKTKKEEKSTKSDTASTANPEPAKERSDQTALPMEWCKPVEPKPTVAEEGSK